MEDRQFGRIVFLGGKTGGNILTIILYICRRQPACRFDPACSLAKLTHLKQEGVDQVWLSHWHEDHIHYMNEFEDLHRLDFQTSFSPLTDPNIFMELVWLAWRRSARLLGEGHA